MSRQSSPIKVEARSILDLCRPPDGYTFVRGAWATHDLDLLTVSEYVAPALVGSVATERRQRKLEGRTTPVGKRRSLLIFPSTEQQTLRGFVPWCHIFPIGGRRQHAKFALLQFESERGGKTRTRVIVMSANLTGSGVRRNRELLAWGEFGHLQTKGSIAPALLREFRTLGRDSGFWKECKPLFDEMDKVMQCAEWPVLRSSIDAPRSLLRDIKIRGKAKRIIVLSPPFASDADDGPAGLLSKYISPRTVIEIYTGAHILPGQAPTKRSTPEFSTAILNVFRQQAGTVQVLAVPELIPDADEPDERPPLRRRLHAKLLALVTEEGEVHLLVGSANFTRSALEGKNRELMISATWSEADLESMLAGLYAVTCDLTEVRPTQIVEERSLTPEPVVLRATFTVDATESPARSAMRGSLKLVGDELPVQIRYRGEVLKADWEQCIWLNESDTGLDVTMADGRTERIPIHVVADTAGFWSRITHEDADVRPDMSWQLLLLDLRKDRRGAAPPGEKSVRTMATPQADGFYIALEQRLVTLARYRHRLRVFAESQEMEKQLRSYFEGQEEARQVACALLSASTELPLDSQDPLLMALRDAMPLFPAKEEPAHA